MVELTVCFLGQISTPAGFPPPQIFNFVKIFNKTKEKIVGPSFNVFLLYIISSLLITIEIDLFQRGRGRLDLILKWYELTCSF